jgi:hypothetical protein
LTFPPNGSIKRKEQGLEILLVSADRAGSPTRYAIWMTGLLLLGGIDHEKANYLSASIGFFSYNHITNWVCFLTTNES